jgi:ABC-2 type transport system permease protein
MRRLARIAFLKARKYAVAASAALRERLAYRGSFLGSGLAYGLFVFVFSRIWTAAFAGKLEIAGYGRTQLVWYFIVAEIPSFAFGGSFWSLAEDVKSGQVAYLVSRPIDFVGSAYFQGVGKALANAAALLVEGLALGYLTAGPPPLASALQALCVLGSLAMAGSVYFLLQLAIAMTAFWVEENSAFFWIFQKLVLVVGTLLPIEFLPPAAQAAAWLSPFPAIAYVPARLMAAWGSGAEAPRLLAFQAAWFAASALGCRLVYALARRRISVNGG